MITLVTSYFIIDNQILNSCRDSGWIVFTSCRICVRELVLQHIKHNITASRDPHENAFRTNRSKKDAISTALHSVFTHLINNESFIRVLFVDFRSVFNAISPMKLIGNFNPVGLKPHPATKYWTYSQAEHHHQVSAKHWSPPRAVCSLLLSIKSTPSSSAALQTMMFMHGSGQEGSAAGD